MRIAFMGKGGSGKTTVAAGMISYMSRLASPIVAVDGDLNVHLGGLLGIEARHLHREMDEIGAWLEPMLSQEMPIIGVTPPTRTSRFIRAREDDPFLNSYATWSQDRRIALLTVGTYEADNAGTHCYHVKLQAAEMLMHRLLDENNDWVINDSTAGIDSN